MSNFPFTPDPIVFEGKHIIITLRPTQVIDGKICFIVWNKHDGEKLAGIAWFSRWKKYSLYPNPNTIWEEKCLRDIANFIEEQTEQVKE